MALTATATAAPELIAARLMASRKGPAGLRNNKDLPGQLKAALGDENEVVVTISLDVKGHKIHIGEFDGYVTLGNMTVKRKRYRAAPQFKHYSLSAGDESVDLFMGDIRIDKGWEDGFNLQRQRAVVLKQLPATRALALLLAAERYTADKGLLNLILRQVGEDRGVDTFVVKGALAEIWARK